MKTCIERLMRFDNIRIMKLIEIIYYTIISFVITLIFTNLLEDDKLFPFAFQQYKYSGSSAFELLKDIIIDLSILAIYIYYLKKLLSCIPFILNPLVPKYKSDMKNEISTGIILGLWIIIYTALPTIKDKIKELDTRVKKYINSIVS